MNGGAQVRGAGFREAGVMSRPSDVRSDALEAQNAIRIIFRSCAGGLPDAPEYRISTEVMWRSVPVAQLDRAQVS